VTVGGSIPGRKKEPSHKVVWGGGSPTKSPGVAGGCETQLVKKNKRSAFQARAYAPTHAGGPEQPSPGDDEKTHRMGPDRNPTVIGWGGGGKRVVAPCADTRKGKGAEGGAAGRLHSAENTNGVKKTRAKTWRK